MENARKWMEKHAEELITQVIPAGNPTRQRSPKINHSPSPSSPSPSADPPSTQSTQGRAAAAAEDEARPSSAPAGVSQKMRVSQVCRCKTAHSRHASQSHSLQENIRLPLGKRLPHQLQAVSSARAPQDRRPWRPAQLKLVLSRPGPGTQNWSHSKKDITPERGG